MDVWCVNPGRPGLGNMEQTTRCVDVAQYLPSLTTASLETREKRKARARLSVQSSSLNGAISMPSPFRICPASQIATSVQPPYRQRRQVPNRSMQRSLDLPSKSSNNPSIHSTPSIPSPPPRGVAHPPTTHWQQTNPTKNKQRRAHKPKQKTKDGSQNRPARKTPRHSISGPAHARPRPRPPESAPRGAPRRRPRLAREGGKQSSSPLRE